MPHGDAAETDRTAEHPSEWYTEQIEFPQSVHRHGTDCAESGASDRHEAERAYGHANMNTRDR